jgi:pyrimidine-nucleoside phosphorylase
MQTKESAVELAKRMQAIGVRLGRKVHCEITSMQDVLGNMVGNALEIKEAIDFLKGKFEPNFHTLIFSSATTLLIATGFANIKDEAKTLIQQVIDNGLALQKLREMISYQNGDERVIDDESILNISKNTVDVYPSESGFVNKVHVKNIGIISQKLGGGRLRVEDDIDHSVGIEVFSKLGDKVEKGKPVCRLYYNKNKESKLQALVKEASNCFQISQTSPIIDPLIIASF